MRYLPQFCKLVLIGGVGGAVAHIPREEMGQDRVRLQQSAVGTRQQHSDQQHYCTPKSYKCDQVGWNHRITGTLAIAIVDSTPCSTKHIA